MEDIAMTMMNQLEGFDNFADFVGEIDDDEVDDKDYLAKSCYIIELEWVMNNTALNLQGLKAVED